MLSSDSKQDINDAIGIGAIGDAHGNANSAEPIEKRPVDHPRPDKLTVGNDDIGAIGCAHHAGAKTNLTHLAETCSNLDGVPNLHGMLKDQDQTRNEVVHHVLQTEPYADAEGAD